MPITKYEGQTLQNKSFVIEESYFINCVLKECDLFYSGGDFEWINVQFENSRWHFRGPALKAMQMFQLLGLLKQPQGPLPGQASSSKMN